jgi:hemerythrin superfamily protein
MDPLDDMEDPGFDEPEAEIDALTLLREDHQEVLALIESFERASGDDRRQELAHRICELLTAHAQIEEEIFYPAVRAAILEQDLLDDAEVEHAVTKGLVEEIRSMGRRRSALRRQGPRAGRAGQTPCRHRRG